MQGLWLYRASLVLRRPVLRFCRGSTHGADRVPVEGPVLLAANHASYLDPWLLAALFPRNPIRFLINDSWYDRSVVWRAFFRSHGVIVARRGDYRATIRRVVGALSCGDVVGVFPEGRLSTDGRPSPARSGVGLMAAESGAPVVPCGLRGAFDLLPRHRRLPRRHPVSLHIGTPIAFPGAPLVKPEAGAVRDFAEAVMREIQRLSGHPELGDPSRTAPA